jgi:hypothetical protein
MDFIVQKFSYIIQIFKVYDVNLKIIESSINFNMIILEKEIKNFQIFFKEFLKRKNKHALIRKFNKTSNEKKITITQLLNNIKKNSHQFIFSLLYGKKNDMRKKKKIESIGSC